MDKNFDETEPLSAFEQNDTYTGLDDINCVVVDGDVEGDGDGVEAGDGVEGGDGLGEVDGDGDEDVNRNGDGNANGDGDDNGAEDGNRDIHYSSDDCGDEYCADGGIVIDGLVDILTMDLKNVSNKDVSRYDFVDLDVAYLFYSWYARINGFSTRKSKVVKSCKGEILQQTFVCSREGFREDKGLTQQMRKRKPKRESRCGCEAKFRVHIDTRSRRWYVTLFEYEHNHELLEDMYCSLLPAHKKLTTTDILQIESFRKVGIRPSLMFGAFANNAGGYEKIGFRMKDIYNQVGKQKQQQSTDSSGALKFLRELGSNDPIMFVRHTVNEEGMLQHLFWSDGESQMNYQLFGDVLAFDATYRKNKYLCPFVIFSGVNHHNQTIVFATALISNETEHTYVWLLEQFMAAMKGKAPTSVITDGDFSMRNAIKKVFPTSHHRLCAWHLLRNAASNVAIPEFIPYFKKCMLGDHDVGRFEQMWDEMVGIFALEENNWIAEMYEKRNMWSTAHIRGTFFASIRTTSRCEALHSHMGKFVHSQISLTDFVQQFHRCMTYFRFREVEADFESDYGDEVLQTNFRCLERSGSRQYTKEIFYLFRAMLVKTSQLRVVDCQELSMYSIYMVTKYRGSGIGWHVSYCPSIVEFSCSCMRMESIGLPCDHILTVLLWLGFNELPKFLVLDRWSKNAKDGIRGSYTSGSFYWDSHLIARYATMHFLCKEVLELAYHNDEDSTHFVDLLMGELNRLKLKYSGTDTGEVHNIDAETVDEIILDPPVSRTKGCGPSTNTSHGRSVRPLRCGNCGAVGHNRRSCLTGKQSCHLTTQDSNAHEEGAETNIPSTSYVADGVL